jgi:hypothetical protein
LEASSEAAKIGSEEFFDPETRTSPESGAPPMMTMRSLAVFFSLEAFVDALPGRLPERLSLFTGLECSSEATELSGLVCVGCTAAPLRAECSEGCDDPR